MNENRGRYYATDAETELFSDGPYPTREAAIEDGREIYEGRTFWIGKSGRSAKEIVATIDVAEEILEYIETRVYDQIHSDDPLVELSLCDQAELDKLVLEFLVSKNAIRDTFEVVEVEEISPLESEAE